MKNCLITKLKGVVDNDMLPHFGFAAFKIDVDIPIINRGCHLSLINPNPGTPNVRILGDGYFVGPNDSNIGKELDTSVTPFDLTGNYKGIYIGSKIILEIYDVKEDGYSADVFFDFREVTSLEVNIDTVARFFSRSQYSGIYAPTLRGSIESFYNKSGYFCSLMAGKDGSKVTGNIDNIVSYLRAPGIISFSNLPNITGSIEGFLNKMLTKWPGAKDRFKFEISKCPKVTYQGISIGESFVKEFSCDGATWVEL